MYFRRVLENTAVRLHKRVIVRARRWADSHLERARGTTPVDCQLPARRASQRLCRSRGLRRSTASGLAPECRDLSPALDTPARLPPTAARRLAGSLPPCPCGVSEVDSAASAPPAPRGPSGTGAALISEAQARDHRVGPEPSLIRIHRQSAEAITVPQICAGGTMLHTEAHPTHQAGRAAIDSSQMRENRHTLTGMRPLE